MSSGIMRICDRCEESPGVVQCRQCHTDTEDETVYCDECAHIVHIGRLTHHKVTTLVLKEKHAATKKKLADYQSQDQTQSQKANRSVSFHQELQVLRRWTPPHKKLGQHARQKAQQALQRVKENSSCPHLGCREITFLDKSLSLSSESGSSPDCSPGPRPCGVVTALPPGACGGWVENCNPLPCKSRTVRTPVVPRGSIPCQPKTTARTPVVPRGSVPFRPMTTARKAPKIESVRSLHFAPEWENELVEIPETSNNHTSTAPSPTPSHLLSKIQHQGKKEGLICPSPFSRLGKPIKSEPLSADCRPEKAKSAPFRPVHNKRPTGNERDLRLELNQAKKSKCSVSETFTKQAKGAEGVPAVPSTTVRDEDELWLLSLLPTLKRLTLQQRGIAKIKVQQCLLEAEFGK